LSGAAEDETPVAAQVEEDAVEEPVAEATGDETDAGLDVLSDEPAVEGDTTKE